MERYRGFLLGMIAVVGVICVLMLLPFMGYILTAALLGFLLHPLYKRLDRWMPAPAASGLVVILTIVAAVLPALFTLGIAAEEAQGLITTLETEDVQALQELELYLEETLGDEIDIRERLANIAQTGAAYMASRASQIFRFAANIAIGTFLMLFVQFFVMKDGTAFVQWTKKFDVMEPDAQEQLYNQIETTTRALIKGHILVAILQGIIAGLGLFVFGIPNVAFWTAVMIFLAFIPLIGTSLVLVPAAIYLGLTGSPGLGIALLLYTFLIVSLSDNVARPLLVDKDAGVHEVFILIGILGGVLLFGAIGIFIGPILFGVLKNLLELYRTTY